MKSDFQKEGITEITFPQFPHHDCVWDVCRGADHNIYFSLCSEGRATTAQLMSFDPRNECIEQLFDVGRGCNDPLKPGKIPQSKIHTTMCPTKDGLIYFATHCTAPPPGEDLFEPVGTCGDPDWGYTGSFVFCFRYKEQEQRMPWIDRAF